MFHDGRADITLASPKGGQPPVDPNSEADEAQADTTRRFSEDDAVFYPGGHGPPVGPGGRPDSIRMLKVANNADKVIGAVCHAPAVSRPPESPNGDYFVRCRFVTGFSNSEEKAADLTGVVPFLVKPYGGNYSRGDDQPPSHRGGPQPGHRPVLGLFRRRR